MADTTLEPHPPLEAYDPGHEWSTTNNQAPAPTDHDPAAEAQVLGAALIDAKALDELATVVDGSQFYAPANETIWEVIADLHAAGEPVDVVILADRLGPKRLRQAGGAPYLHNLVRSVVSPANAPYYAEIVRDHALRRRLTQAGHRVLQLADQAAGDGDTSAVIAAAVAEVAHVQVLAADPRADHGSTWQPVDIATLDLEHVQQPVLLERGDGKALLYAESVHSFVGEPESGKSFLAQYAVAQQLIAGLPAAYIDFEDRPGRVVRRMLDLGVPKANVVELFRYIRPDVALTAALMPHLERAVRDCVLAVVDGVTEAMTLHGLSLTDNEDIARFLALLPRRIADCGPAVVQVDHVVKDAEARGRYAIGGQHKLAGIDGAQFKVVVSEPFGKGKRGHANVIVDKDREGGVRQHTVGIKIADFILDSTAVPSEPDRPVGPLRVYLDAPDPSVVGEHGEFRPTHKMSAISEYIEMVPGCGVKDIEDNVTGNSTTIRDATRVLIKEGYVRVEGAAKGARHHYSITPFSASSEGSW